MFHENPTDGCCGKELDSNLDGVDHVWRKKNAQKNLDASTSDA